MDSARTAAGTLLGGMMVIPESNIDGLKSEAKYEDETI